METRHIRHFLAIADHGSVTRAADALGIAQPALSQSIRRLEKQLQVRLFDRSRRGSALTTAGQAIIEEMRLSVAKIDAATVLAREISQGLAGTLTIGIISAAFCETLPETIRLYRKRTPNVRLVLREMGSLEQANALEKGEIDIGLLQTPLTVRGRMNQRLIARDRLIGVVHDGFRVGADQKVSLRDLAREGLVFFPQQQLPLFHAGICTAIRALGEEVRLAQEANRTVTILACVAARCGVSLLASSIRKLKYPGVRYFDIRERQSLPEFFLSAIWPARSKPTLADGFAELLGSVR